MNSEKNVSSKSVRNMLLASAVAAGVAGFGLGQAGTFSVTPSYADAVRVEAPAVFSFGDVVEAVSPAVVSVRVEAGVQPANDLGNFQFDRRGGNMPFGLEKFFRNFPDGEFRRGPGNKQRFGMSQGSGFFVSEDGYLVTNNHVISNGSKFTVVMSDGTEHEATLVGSDSRTDLAVLKVEADNEFTYVDFSDKRPRIGDWVVAVGNPFGLGGTVTAGIVSAHGREINANRYDDFIQIDAAVNKGNSGGPAFNLNGEVVGINTAIFSPSGGNVGIAFAIPAATAEEIVTDLIEHGQVVRGWLGVQIQPVTPEIAESLGLAKARGAIVTSPQEGSPAEKAGLKSGDVITAVDGKNVKGPKALARVIGEYSPKSSVKLDVWRNGGMQEIRVTLGELETASFPGTPGVKTTSLAKLGISVEAGADGVVVVGVETGSDAAKKGMRTGDVITSVNGEEVSTPSDLKLGLDAVEAKGRKSALLQVIRENQTIFVPVPLARG